MRSKVVGVVASLIAVLVVLGFVWQALGGIHAFSALSVKDLVSSNTDISPEDKTEELCADLLCLEGWRTDIGAFLRFKSAGEAEYWATVLGDEGLRYENLVLDLRGYSLSFEERRLAIDILFSRYDWN